MSQENDQSVSRTARQRRPVVGFVAAALLLGGCSAVPDWADPTDWFASDAAPTRVGLAEGQARSQPTGFPNLASVPNQPPKVLSLEARAEVQAGLAADRVNAVYSGEKLTGSPPMPANAGQTVSDAPAAPKIGNELTAALRVPPAPVATQVAQAPAVQAPAPQAPAVQAPMIQVPAVQAPATQAPMDRAQIAQASGGGTQLHFPQFQNPQPRIAMPYAAGAQLVAVIYFGHSSSRLDGKDRAVLRDVVALSRQRGGVIRVIGHASALTGVSDQINHDLTNFEMSLKRANSVAAALIALGAERDQVSSEARSDKQPVYHEFMTTGQAGNRRVEIFLEN